MGRRVLITGSARGIGRATALRLDGLGWDVVAGVRRKADGEALRKESSGRLEPVVLDVTKKAGLERAATLAEDRLDAVVNNAGIVVAGPLETLTPADLRTQLEVNVVGAQAVTAAVLPALRRSVGRVVFVSSVSGVLSSPFMGAYCSSKFALEGMADALRMELAPWRIGVSVIQPTSIDTDLWRNVTDDIDEAEERMSDDQRELYGPLLTGVRKVSPAIAKQAAPVESVVAAIEKALTDPKPKPRYTAGRGASVQAAAARVTPSFVTDRAQRKLFGA